MKQEKLKTVAVESFVREALDSGPEYREMLFLFGFVIAAVDAVVHSRLPV